MNVLVVNILFLCILILIISVYSLNIRKPYPKHLMELFHEPLTRFITYILIYVICVYNPLLGLFSALPVILLHIDYINLYIK